MFLLAHGQNRARRGVYFHGATLRGPAGRHHTELGELWTFVVGDAGSTVSANVALREIQWVFVAKFLFHLRVQSRSMLAPELPLAGSKSAQSKPSRV
jgi:hypothetical protein